MPQPHPQYSKCADATEDSSAHDTETLTLSYSKHTCKVIVVCTAAGGGRIAGSVPDTATVSPYPCLPCGSARAPHATACSDQTHYVRIKSIPTRIARLDR
jgi:hypothetical protein